MNKFGITMVAMLYTAVDQFGEVGGLFVKPWLANRILGEKREPRSGWASSSLATEKAVDGAILSGVEPPNAYAKYALPKGLPTDRPTLAIENDPHTIDDFSGKIEQGYGKGTKKLLVSQRVPVKVEGRVPYLGKINYHVHDADRAGLHYDLVVEGVKPGTKQFEINIPNGSYKGRYAFVTTDRGMMAIKMKDRGVILPKPTYKLRGEDLLNKVTELNRLAPKGAEPYIVEWKPDGSLGNASIESHRVVYRSHRETGETYYDRLPGLEFIRPESRFFVGRYVSLTPDLEGTVLQGELFHPKGVGFVSGVLNSLPERAQLAQRREGNVSFIAWDIDKYRGKDVSSLPYGERREILEKVIGEIRPHNSHYEVVAKAPPRGDMLRYYRRIVEDKRGLPWSEGVVVKDRLNNTGWWEKVKASDTTDVLIDGFVEGNGDLADSLGAIWVRSPDGTKMGKVGTGFTDLQAKWIWDNQDKLHGAMVKVRVLEETDSSFRAPRFEGFHGDKGGNDFGLQMYSYELALGDPKEAKRIMYSLKSARGWTPK